MNRLVLFLACALVTAACGGGDGRTEVVVSAASSLTDAFADIEAAFELDHPDIDVVLNIGGSSALREQILAGAPVDVFASADANSMAGVSAAGLTAVPPITFAQNRLQIAVPRGNPAVASLSDFARPELLIGLCAQQAPCGTLARELLTVHGVDADVDTNEPDVRALRTKLVAGELDAGLVYLTDVIGSSGALEGIDIDGPATPYLIAILQNATDKAAAGAFVTFVQSSVGTDILAGYGFDVTR